MVFGGPVLVNMELFSDSASIPFGFWGFAEFGADSLENIRQTLLFSSTNHLTFFEAYVVLRPQRPQKHSVLVH